MFGALYIRLNFKRKAHLLIVIFLHVMLKT